MRRERARLRRDADVVAVIGTLNSPCAVAAVPELNRAPRRAARDGLAAELVRRADPAGPGVDRERCSRRSTRPAAATTCACSRPTTSRAPRSRCSPAIAAGAAVFVLDDGEPGYGVLLATGFATAARRLGLRGGGARALGPGRALLRGAGGRVAASRAGAVFVGGLLDTNAARVVRALRAALGPGVDISGPTAYAAAAARPAGRRGAARGVFVSLAGVLTERLPPGGAAFARRFAATQAGAPVEPSRVYAAQAAEVVLDAIARSDGTRASVLDELFRDARARRPARRLRVRAQRRHHESPVTILRVADGGERPGRGRRRRARLRPPARLVE